MGFEEWVRQQLPAMLRLATALCGSPQPAEDLVQTVLIRAHARWARIQTLDQPGAYLRRMLVNEHLSWRRRLAAALRRDTLSASAISGQRQPFDQQQVDRMALVEALRTLPPRERAAVVLRYLDDYTVAETAHLLNCTPSTVRAYTSRALARLRLTLPDAAPDPLTGEPFSPAVKDRHAH